MTKLIGICGWINSGKGTVGDILESEFGFVKESFAKPLKDAVAIIFNWPRELLEGDTKESREFRELKDEYWSEKLDYEVTPRLILQKFGTEAVREGIGNSVWLDSLEIRLNSYTQYVITDVRFQNEIELIKKLGGEVIWVIKGDAIPEWYSNYKGLLEYSNFAFRMEKRYPEIHQSEWDWVMSNFDYILTNNGTLEDLNKNVSEMLEYFYLNTAIKSGALKNV